jgi:hypothetical protein
MTYQSALFTEWHKSQSEKLGMSEGEHFEIIQAVIIVCQVTKFPFFDVYRDVLKGLFESGEALKWIYKKRTSL